MICENCIDCDFVNGCIECLIGFYGDDCKEICLEGCRDCNCDNKFGICLNGCIDGYIGDNCKMCCRVNCIICIVDGLCILCLVGIFGIYCKYVCLNICGGNKLCFKING